MPAKDRHWRGNRAWSHEAAQVHLYLTSRLVAAVRIFVQRLEDQAVKRWRNGGIQRRGLYWLAIQYRVYQSGMNRIAKRTLTGSHFVENDAKGVDIAAGVRSLAAQLLRGSVEERSFEVSLGHRDGNIRLTTIKQLSKPKIHYFGDTLGRDHNIAGFEISMDDTVLMRLLERGCNLNSYTQQLFLRQRTSGEPLGKCGARNTLHNEVVNTHFRVEIE